MSQAGEILTLDQLAERWSCCRETALARVRDPARPVPYFTLGQPQGTKRRKEMMRFRLASVARWEADQERVATSPGSAEPAGRPANYDGPDHVGEAMKRRAKRLAGKK